MVIKLREVTATTTAAAEEEKYSEAEKPRDNWHFITDFLHLLYASSVPVVALCRFVAFSPRLDAAL